jgi:integrase
MVDVKRVLVPDQPHEIWTIEELSAFLEHMKGVPFWGTVFRFMCMTGVRRGELQGLRWRDVDLKKSEAHIQQQINLKTQRPAPLKGKNSYRRIALDALTLQQLVDLRKEQVTIRLQAAQWEDNDLVFATVDRYHNISHATLGHWLCAPTIANHLRALCIEVGVPYIKPHGLRHTHATIHLAEGMSPKALAERMGHDVKVLLSTYAHALPYEQVRAQDRLAELLERQAVDNRLANAGQADRGTLR